MTKVDKLVWVVLWQVWKPNDHDWIGRLKLGRRFLVDRRPLPEVQRKSFTSRKAADRFAAKLRRGNTAQIDVVTTVLDPPPVRPPAPYQPRLPGDWPLQRPRVTNEGGSSAPGGWPAPSKHAPRV